MKLWYSFTKELKLSSKSFYFYIEVGMAAILLALLILVIPDSFTSSTTEYIYLNVPQEVEDFLMTRMLVDDLDNEVGTIELKVDGEKKNFDIIETDDKKVILLTSVEEVIEVAEKERKLGAVLNWVDNDVVYDYHLQGYESDKLLNLYRVFHNKDIETMEASIDTKKVVKLSENYEGLSDRENIIPAFLTFNGSLMGLFIIASYIFLDKKEGIITAYAVTASPMRNYLLSKVGVVMVTSVLTSLIMVIPIMGLQPNYLMLLLFLVCSGFFASSLGLVLTSFYNNIMQAFGVLYLLIMVLMLPNIAYFVPSWDPLWLKFIPSHFFLQSFKEVLLPNGDMMFVLMTSGAFLGAGILLFAYGIHRYKITLTL